MHENAKYNKAIEFAEIAYSNIKRRSGEELIDHAYRVVKILKDIGIIDDSILIAALLHAVPKETNIPLEDITTEFDEDITSIISNLDNISKIQFPRTNDDDVVKNIHKLLIHLSSDVRVLIIRLADRIDNIRTIDALTKEEQIWAANVCLNIDAPISKAVGMNYFTKELENASLKVLEPKRYRKIEKFLKSNLPEYEEILKYIENTLKEDLKKYSKNFKLSGRVKSIYSIHKKAVLKHNTGVLNSPDDFNKLYDLLGFRIIVENVDNCYKALADIQKHWPLVMNEYDDYIENPKPNGYKTLQTAVSINDHLNCEIQIRTFDMHEFNEYGPASHFAYKYKQSNKEKSTWIKDLISAKEDIQKGLGINSKIKLFEDTVFVYTPKNDLIVLPKGSCPIDFAYAVHSTVGNTCFSASVNGKQVPLTYQLESGDCVEIITRKNKEPSRDWLNIVKSHEARRNIRKHLGESIKPD